MRNSLLLLVLLAGTCWVAQAQPVGKSQYGALIETAERSMEVKDYYNALINYEEAYDDRNDPKLLPMIADVNLKLRDYARAQRFYALALRRDKSGKLEDLRYDYGVALKMYEKYDEAKEQFELFLKTNPNEPLKTLAQNQLTGIEMAQAYKDDNKDEFKPKRLGKEINKKFSEYAGRFGRDGSLYFATYEADDVIFVDAETTDFYAKIYQSAAGDKGFEEPKALGQNINRPGFHTSNVAFSADGNRMYFTRSNLLGNTVMESKIYFSVGGDGNWGAANEVLGVNGDWIATHPAPGELFGREVLFFSANIDGGYGGFDLYYATYKGEGVYAEPVNLGPTINGPGDEITPFYFDGTLYFSSDGWPGFGGQDIFYTVWDGQRWSETTNLGGRYNSSQDDQHFALDEDGYKGFFTSNRPGGLSVHSRTCCDDIYTFELEKITAALIAGTFTTNRKPLIGATVRLTDLKMATNKSQTQAQINRFDFPLDLETTYQIIASKEGYFPDTATLTTLDLTESKIFEQRFYLDKIPPPPPVEPEFDTITIEEAIVLENILYEFNDDKILPAAESDLKVVLDLLNQYPKMKIELSSHTDYRGNDDYNENLSQRRAESARKWLLGHDIAEDRIVAKGYGETQPQTISERMVQQHTFFEVGQVLTQAFIDDSLAIDSLREIAHQINRRTEFKIIEGPTSITIKRTSLRKKPTEEKAPNRNRQPGGSASTLPPIVIDKLSTLFGQTDLKGVPIMLFEKRFVDFGAVKKGEKREVTYEFTNRGSVPLTIDLISACDCTTATNDKDVVKPGEKGKIHVIFDSAEKDEAETINIDIFLKENDNKGNPIIETIEYKFDIVK